MNTRGFTLLEVLITLIILAVGMLGLANLQSKIHVTEVESYQRAHAVLLLEDMIDRINSNRQNAGAYASADVLGTGDDYDDGKPDDLPADCQGPIGAARDRCEWSEALRGASEQRVVGGVKRASGGMIDARGCIEELQVRNTNTGVCTPGVYRVTVVWQGLHTTAAPPMECGKDLYGNEGMRRAIAAQTSLGTPACSS